MKHFIKSLLVISLSCLLLNCTPTNTAQRSNASKLGPALIPLAVGNTWTYTRLETNETLQSKVEKSQNLNGTTWYLYNEVGERFWVRNEGMNQYEALDFYDAEEIKGEEIKTAMVLNVDAASYSFESVESASYRKCKTSITVPAGTFACHLIRFELGQGEYSENYFKEGIGLLKSTYHTSNDTRTIELVDYQLF